MNNTSTSVQEKASPLVLSPESNNSVSLSSIYPWHLLSSHSSAGVQSKRVHHWESLVSVMIPLKWTSAPPAIAAAGSVLLSSVEQGSLISTPSPIVPRWLFISLLRGRPSVYPPQETLLAVCSMVSSQFWCGCKRRWTKPLSSMPSWPVPPGVKILTQHYTTWEKSISPTLIPLAKEGKEDKKLLQRSQSGTQVQTET